MDKGLTVPEWVLRNRPKNTPNAPKFICPNCLHTGYIEVIMQGKCGRNTETTFDIK